VTTRNAPRRKGAPHAGRADSLLAGKNKVTILLHIVALFCYWRMDQPCGVDAKRPGKHQHPFRDRDMIRSNFELRLQFLNHQALAAARTAAAWQIF